MLNRNLAQQSGRTITLAARDGVDWHSGWLLWDDANQNAQADTGEICYREYAALPSSLVVLSRFSSQQASIAFNQDGQSLIHAGSQQVQSGSLIFSQGRHQRIVTINFIGRARLCDPARDKGCAHAPIPAS